MIDDRFLPRVWTDKGYYYPIFSELGITYENKNLPFTKENLKDINWAFRWHFNHFNENVDMEYINTLEQCTGLNDKNGRLIYAGDILGNKDFMSDVALLKYNNEKCCYILERRSVDERFNKWWADRLMVIGNIHENKELLK